MDSPREVSSFNPDKKAQIALQLLSGRASAPDLAKEHNLAESEIQAWSTYLRESAPLLFREIPGSSAQRLRSILESMEDLIFVLNEHLIIEALHVPDSARWHMDPDRVFGRTFPKIDFPEPARSLVLRTLSACQQSSQPQRCQYSVSQKNELRWFDLRATPLTDAAGTESGITCAIREITSLKRTQMELEASREQFRLAVRGANDGIWDWDLRQNSLYLSPKWKEQLGYEEHQLENSFDSFKDLLHPEDAPTVIDYIQRYLQGAGGRFEIDFRMRHRDGSFRWIHARGQAILDQEGVPIRMAGSHTDITDRKEAEFELQRQGQLQELLTEIAVTYINLPLNQLENSLEESLGQMGRFVGADRCYIFDYNFDRKTCSNTYEWCAEGIAPEIQNLQDVPLDMVPDWLEVHRKGEPMFVPDVTALPPSGLRDILEPQGIKSLLALPLLKDGQPIGFVGFDSVHQHHQYTDYEHRLLAVFAELLVNVHMRRIAENQLRDATVRAEAANVAKSEFLANMSHELRTPMNGIIGMSELILETDLNPQQHRYAANVKRSADSLLVLLNDILDFSKIEAGKLGLESIPFQLDSLMEELASIHGLQAAEKKQLELVFTRRPDLPDAFVGDPARLRQILVNLIGNAIKFTETGEVVLEVASLPVANAANTVWLTFSVRDTGIGIPPEKQNQLFQKFSQVDNSISRQFGGTGLGLAISDQLASLMGCHIEVNSPLRDPVPDDGGGPGSQFSFHIPLQTAPNTAGKIVPDLQDTQIMIVDDNASCRDALASSLQAWGAKVLLFPSGSDALRHLYSSSTDSVPDMVFIDESMPNMTGSDLAKTLQSDPSLQNLTLIQLLASHSRLQRVTQDQKSFFRSSLVKPINRSDLAEALAAIGGPTESSQGSPKASLPLEAPVKAPSNANILLVEDNPINSEVATAWLRQFGLPVDHAANGPEALKALQSKSYSLVFMDIQMPGMNGIETTRRIRKDLRLNSIPIIAMTAHTMAGDRERCLGSGMNDFISKPLNRAGLHQILQRWLPDKDSPPRDNPSTGDSPSDASQPFQLQRMLAFIQNENIARGLLRSFLKNLPTELQKLQNALANDDRPQIQETAHGIKGVAGYFCADSLKNTAATMEQEAHRANTQRLQCLFDDLQDKVSLIRNAILEQTPSDWLDDHPST